MKLKEHINVIKSFSDITNAMILTSDKIKIINQSNSIFASYEWGEKLPVEKIGIYDVKALIQILSLFNDYEIEVDEKKLIIKEGNRKSEYFVTDPEHIKYDGREIKEDKLGEPNIVLKMDKNLHKKIKDVISVISATHINFNEEADNLVITLKDNDNTSNPSYEIKIPKSEVTGSLENKVIMYADDFMMYDGDYEVKIYTNKIFRFINAESKLEYFIALKK